jgi:hypothetical protein
VLIHDNDEPGRTHMHKVAANLKGLAASIKWLELPDLPEKGDVSDFIAMFPDGTRLRTLIGEASEYQEPEPEPEPASPKDDIPPFPDIMSGAAGEFAEVYSDVLESPKQFFFMSFLVCLGSVLSRGLNHRSGRPLYPNKQI